MNNDILKIKSIVNNSDFLKGRSYFSHYIEFVGVEQNGNNNIFNFNVESERTYDIYRVKIEGFKGSINNVSCTCPQFKSTIIYNNLSSCLINYKNEIFY